MAFEKVSAEAILQGCVRKENAWNIITDFARYSTIMDNVDTVEVTERSRDEGVSRWHVSVDDAPLYWAEKDFFNRRNFQIMFKSFEGDFDNINGCWRIANGVGSGIKITFEVEYNLGIPVIEEVLGSVLREKMKINIDKMLSAVQKELCSSATDERGHGRHTIGRAHTCTLNSRPMRLDVLNVSAGGMMTRYLSGAAEKGTMNIAAIFLDIAEAYADEPQNICRFVFRRPLEEKVLASLVSNLTTGSGRILPSRSVPQEALVYCDEQEVPIRILDLSPEGMSFSYQGKKAPAMESFTIGSTAISLKETVHDDKHNLVRVAFSETLSNEQFNWVCERFKIGKK